MDITDVVDNQGLVSREPFQAVPGSGRGADAEGCPGYERGSQDTSRGEPLINGQIADLDVVRRCRGGLGHLDEA
jgi:hypothetical protein